MAARWATPASTTPTYKAIKMYRNYDGNQSSFGDTSVSASVPNPDNVSAFAAARSADGALTIMVVNNLLRGRRRRRSTSAISHRGAAQPWQLTSANAITRIADLAPRHGIVVAPGAEHHAVSTAPIGDGPAPPAAHEPQDLRVQ